MKVSLFNRIVLGSYILMYGVSGSESMERYGIDSKEFWYITLLCLGLVTFSGFCSGATQGLLSIDQLSLELKIKHGTPQEKQMATQLLPVLEQHHLLLSTLLISNATANESLPIFMHLIVPDWAAVLISSIFVVLLGEVVPSAYTTGPDQLSIAVKMIPYIKILQSILYIICYPLSLFLDWILGIHNKTRYPIRDLRTLLQLHAETPELNMGQGSILHQNKNNPLSKEEINLINSTMDLRDELVTKQHIDISKVFMVSSEEKFSMEFVHKLKIKGFSRVPVYLGDNKQNIMGTFDTKSILRYTEQDYGKAIRNLVQLTDPLIVCQNTSMLQMLMIFQEKRKTLSFITDKLLINVGQEDIHDINRLVLKPRQDDIGQIISIICLNDVFEEMLDIELKDDDIHGTISNVVNYEKINLINNLEKSKKTNHKLRIIKEEKNESIEKGLEENLLQKNQKH